MLGFGFKLLDPRAFLNWHGLLWMGVATCLSTCIHSTSAQEVSPSKIATYSRAIAQAQADLDAGRIAEAKQRLDETDKAQRSFEFDYLHARAERAPADGKPAPDLIQKIPKPAVDVRYAALNATNRQIAYICRDGALRIYDLGAPDAEPKLVKHPQASAVWSGAFSSDGKRCFSGHENGEVLVWDAASWDLQHTIPVTKALPIRELTAAADGSAFVAEGEKHLELWSLADEQPKKVTEVGERYNFGEGMAFSPKGDLLATGGMFDILLHNAETGKPAGLMRHASYTMGLQFSPDGMFIASAPRGNVNKFLAVFDVARQAEVFNAGPFRDYIVGMAFTPDGRRIAATGCEKLFRIFDAATGEIALSLKRPECGSNPGFSADGRLLGWNEPDGFRFIDLGELSQ